VRRYLRATVGAPIGLDRIEGTEVGFVAAVARWAIAEGVDRRTLLRLGVSPSVLTLAGVRQVPVLERLRRFWAPAPFTIADLVRRSGFSETSIRRAVDAGLKIDALRLVVRTGRTNSYEPVA
jgi:hypothetical protein